VLADSWRDLFLTWIANQVVLDFWIHNEDRLQMMDVFPLSSLRENIYLWTNISIGDLWQLCLNIESEASEILDVDAATCLDMLLDVLNE